MPEDFPRVLCANPAMLEDAGAFFDEVLPETRAVLVRLLGGRRAWPEGLEELRRRCERLGIPLLAFGGEVEPDAELTALSTAPSGAVAEAFEYLRWGGVSNTANLLRFVADRSWASTTRGSRTALPWRTSLRCTTTTARRSV